MPGDSGVRNEALGQSETFLAFQEKLSRVAKVNRPVLILGERGTGKELAASRLHYLSTRWEESFVALDCASLSPTLIEAELFGHESGAFTGARTSRAGRFEAADNGTLFLDEIGNIPLAAQEKILRVVEYNTFQRVGSSESIHVDVRIVAATNANLKNMAARGEFRSDLLDRLSFEVLFVPPLRERGNDIMLLAAHFASRMAHELGREGIPEFSSEVQTALEEYSWPGNVRQLKSVVERAVYLNEGTFIDGMSFDPFEQCSLPDSTVAGTSPVTNQPLPDMKALPEKPFAEAVRDFETALIRDALLQSRFNQRVAAERLRLTYDQFRGLYRKYQAELQAT